MLEFSIKPTELIVEQPESTSNKNFLSKTNLGLLIGIASLVFALPTFLDYFKSDHKKFVEKTQYLGELKAPKFDINKYIMNDLKFFKVDSATSIPAPEIKGIDVHKVNFNPGKPFLVIASGRMHDYFTSDLLNGVNLITKFDSTSDATLSIKVINNRLYASAVFKDIKTGEVSGNMSYNKWKLYDERILDFHADDDRLEVIDQNSKVAFALNYRRSSLKNDHTLILHVSGYFMGSKSIVVLKTPYDTGRTFISIPYQTLGWKDSVLEMVNRIVPLFPDN